MYLLLAFLQTIPMVAVLKITWIIT
jgi:hypothetical protein